MTISARLVGLAVPTRWRGMGVAIGLAAGLTLLGGGTTPASAQTAEEAPAETAAPADADAEKVPTALAQFTTGIEEREPIDQVTFVRNDVRRIYFFSDLRDLQGSTVTHRWVHDGQTMAEVPFEVRGPRWRVWSSKQLQPGWLGDWTVEIVTQDGEVVASESFTYTAAEP